MSNSQTTHQVNPGRLEPGVWSEEFNKTVGEGDIVRSYCADTIALHGKIRRPFIFQSNLWVCVGRSGEVARAYTLVPIDDFNAEEINDQHLHNHAARRAQTLGYYHGVVVNYRKDWFVIAGPEVCFAPGAIEQPGLFAEL